MRRKLKTLFLAATAVILVVGAVVGIRTALLPSGIEGSAVELAIADLVSPKPGVGRVLRHTAVVTAMVAMTHVLCQRNAVGVQVAAG